MDQDEIWAAIDAQRLSVAELLEQLSDDEWRRPSLCEGWTVRDVAAHLTLQQVGMAAAAKEIIRSGGRLNKAIHDWARRRAALPTDQLIAEIRGMVGSRRHNPGVSNQETLIDMLVHGQDIAIPLHRDLAMPPEASAVAATRVWSLGAPFHAKKKMDGFRLTATDTTWTAGQGLDVQAPIGMLLLLITGRGTALPHLSGPGAPELTSRLSPVVS